MKKAWRDYAYLLTLAAIVIVLDQYTKHLVRTSLAVGESWSPWPWLEPFARIVHWKNTGAAFGMLQNFGDVFKVLAIIVAIVILYYFPQVPRQDWPLRLAMGLQMGGALGNFVDRVRQGYVIDFVSLGSFAVFNVADASISVGVTILIIGVWLKDKLGKKPAEKAANIPGTEQAEPLSEEPGGE